MVADPIPTDEPISINLPASRKAVREDLRAVFGVEDVKRVPGSVFGDSDNAPGSQNTFGHTGNAIPRVFPDGTEMSFKSHRVSQLFHVCDTRTAAEHIVDTAVAFLEQDQQARAANWQVAGIVDKVAEAFAFKMAIAEDSVEEAVLRHTRLQATNRTTTEVARDESANIDLRFFDPKTGDDVTVQVKTDTDTTPAKGADYHARVDSDAEEVTFRPIK